MSLFDTSVVSNGTLAKGATTVAIAQKALNVLMPRTSNALLSGLRSGTSSATGLLGGTLGTAVKTVESTLSSAESYVVNGIGSFFGSVDKSATKGLSSLFSNTTDATAQNVKDTIPDATASSFGSKVPMSKGFVLQRSTSATTPASLTGDTSTSQYGLSNILGGGRYKTVSTAASRLGLSLPTTTSDVTAIQAAAASAARNSVSGTTNGSLTSANLLDYVLGTSPGYASQSQFAADSSTLGVGDFQDMIGGLSQLLTGSNSGLNSYYSNSGGVVDAAGNVIDNTNVSASQLNSINNVMQRLGCSSGTGLYTSYSSQMSIYGLLMSLTGSLGLQSELTTLLNCQLINTPYGMSSATSTFKNLVSSLPAAAETILDKIGASNAGMTAGLARSAVQNTSVTTQADATAINSILTATGYNASSVYTNGSTIANTGSYVALKRLKASAPSMDGIVWDEDLVQASPRIVVDTVIGSKTVGAMLSSNRVALSVDVNGDLSDATYSSLGITKPWTASTILA